MTDFQVKRFNLNGDLLQEIGSFGKNPGQFRSAEVVAVDQLGFILVGDAGNARVNSDEDALDETVFFNVIFIVDSSF